MDLIKLSRQEKDNPSLLELTDDFYNLAKASILAEEREASEALNDLEKDLLKSNACASGRALNNLAATRTKKLIKMAVSDAYRKEPKHKADFMQPTERALYDSIIVGILNIK